MGIMDDVFREEPDGDKSWRKIGIPQFKKGDEAHRNSYIKWRISRILKEKYMDQIRFNYKITVDIFDFKTTMQLLNNNMVDFKRLLRRSIDNYYPMCLFFTIPDDLFGTLWTCREVEVMNVRPYYREIKNDGKTGREN